MVFRSTSRCPARPGHAAQQLIGQLLIDQPRRPGEGCLRAVAREGREPGQARHRRRPAPSQRSRHGQGQPRAGACHRRAVQRDERVDRRFRHPLTARTWMRPSRSLRGTRRLTGQAGTSPGLDGRALSGTCATGPQIPSPTFCNRRVDDHGGRPGRGHQPPGPDPPPRVPGKREQMSGGEFAHDLTGLACARACVFCSAPVFVPARRAPAG